MFTQGRLHSRFTQLGILQTSQFVGGRLRDFLYPGFDCRPIDGISTYNVVPFEAGAYFNKIQCFCFEEQRLNPGEEVSIGSGSWINHLLLSGGHASLLLHL